MDIPSIFWFVNYVVHILMGAICILQVQQDYKEESHPISRIIDNTLECVCNSRHFDHQVWIKS